MVVDGSDDVVAGGFVSVPNQDGVRFFVVKLNGVDGSDFGPGGFPGGWPDSSPRPAAVPNANPGNFVTSLGMPPLEVVPVDRFFATPVQQVPFARALRQTNGWETPDVLWLDRWHPADPLLDSAWSALAGW